MFYPGSEHAAAASPNDPHEQPEDTSEANAEPTARKSSDMNRPEGNGLQQKSCESRAECPIQRVKEHPAIRGFFDSCVEHGKNQAAGNQQSQWQRWYISFDDIRDIRMQKNVPAEKCDGCEKPCAYREQADARIERSPPSPRRCSPQPGYTAHDPRVTKQTKG